MDYVGGLHGNKPSKIIHLDINEHPDTKFVISPMDKKRDQLTLEQFQKHHPALVLFAVVMTAGMVDAPCRPRPQVSGVR